MPDPLVLYSTNTELAYRINEHYYGQIHYVWCNPYFNADSAPKLDIDMPPSSTPCDIYHGYLKELDRKERHRQNIDRNKLGLLRGIDSKRRLGVITEAQQRELRDLVEAAGLECYRPLVYVIPFAGVAQRARLQSPAERAALFSQEILIEQLPRQCFDVLWW
jgi:hypothetical protein